MSEASDALAEGFNDLLDQHGQPVTINTRDGLVLSFAGIFEDPALEGTIGTLAIEADTRPRIVCWHGEVTSARRDDTLVTKGVTYSILEVLPDADNHGIVIIGPYYPASP